MPAESFEQFVAELPTNVSKTTAPNMATPEQVEAINKRILENMKAEVNQVNLFASKACTCALLQMGAASPKFDVNKSYTVGSITVDTKSIRKAISDIDSSVTTRKLARALRDDIALMAEKNGILGNLSKSYLLQHPTAQSSELIWASDFQTFNQNSRIPNNVSEWLLQNYNNRFDKSNNKSTK
jgi:hypothetical protein